MTRQDLSAPGCGTCHPPADDTAAREIIDRFRDFLDVAPPPLTPGDTRSHYLDGLSPARRWRVRFLAWKLMQPLPAVDATSTDSEVPSCTPGT